MEIGTARTVREYHKMPPKSMYKRILSCVTICIFIRDASASMDFIFDLIFQKLVLFGAFYGTCVAKKAARWFV